jgi:Holliday junction resolvase
VSITTEEERELRKLVEEAGVSVSRGASFGSYIDTVRLE